MLFFDILPQTTFFGVILALVVVWCIQTAVYRLYFSPIAHFPGPKLAAFTLWYEFYYDAWLGGQYVFKIHRLHAQYGPIIRINPYELHIDTPEFYDELYAGSSKKRDKYRWHNKWAANDSSAWGSIDHDIHRMRRGVINLFFSKASVRRLQPVIQERVDQLLSRIKGFKVSGKRLTISLAYVALSSDVIADYSFGRRPQRLEQEDFDPAYAQAMHEQAATMHFNNQIYWPFQLLTSLPHWLALAIAPNISLYIDFVLDCAKSIEAIKNGSCDLSTKTSHPTLFQELLEGDVPDSEKSIDRLVQEAQVVVSAGTETTAWCLSVITFYILTNPTILERLRVELEEAIPDPDKPVPVENIEQLPYLTACIQEGLRLSYGLSTRLPRVSPVDVMVFNDGKKDWHIPPGTPTSMTSYLIHHNESIFPKSHEYIPQRWIDDPRLDKYLISFSKGTRQCAGINLAYAELYTTLANIFRRYGGPESTGPEGSLELFETMKQDVEMVADMFIPFVKRGSKGIQVFVK
ncbi:Cyrochrome P450 monooxygenase [Lachnellula hyalina]|uniref:Cyrochrome P450 monooxygenase n=1 Tax=Lachnellula hyalina TaxID=1316788 RepID=A0A8H8U0D7_9HELO|nr:Cyrochrome P450 monooxygenase [Lachnellula hyalina]TVY28782.1 Cyrochrome P450 monooxygenase [Lachnellula hyalina]